MKTRGQRLEGCPALLQGPPRVNPRARRQQARGVGGRGASPQPITRLPSSCPRPGSLDLGLGVRPRPDTLPLCLGRGPRGRVGDCGREKETPPTGTVFSAWNARRPGWPSSPGRRRERPQGREKERAGQAACQTGPHTRCTRGAEPSRPSGSPSRQQLTHGKSRKGNDRSVKSSPTPSPHLPVLHRTGCKDRLCCLGLPVETKCRWC